MNRLELLVLLLLNVFVSPAWSMGWLIDLKHGGRRAANKIARKHNLVNRGNVSTLTPLHLKLINTIVRAHCTVTEIEIGFCRELHFPVSYHLKFSERKFKASISIGN